MVLEILFLNVCFVVRRLQASLHYIIMGLDWLTIPFLVILEVIDWK